MMTEDEAVALLEEQVRADPNALAETLEAFVVWCQANFTSDWALELAEDERRGWDDCLDALPTAARHVIGAVP